MSLKSLTILARQSPNQYANCTFETCDISTSFWDYRPSLVANSVFLALFSISLLGFLLTYSITRRTVAFTIALGSGCTLEILGYLGRILSSYNPWHETGFLLQIICLTIAPAFMAAGIYLCLRRIVYAFGKENSRISPEAYTRVFIPCDLISLILQALGGALASEASHQNKSSALGDHIMVAGLAFQALTLAVFMVLCADFALQTIRRYRELNDASLNPKTSALRSSMKFRGFLSALTIASICIFVRSVYRVAELSEGWTGYLIKQQGLFIGLEGVMVLVAMIVLNIFHPAFCFIEGVDGLGGLGAVWSSKDRRQHRTVENKEDISSA